MSRYGTFKLWWDDAYLERMTGMKWSWELNPWLETMDGLRFRREEVGRRINDMRNRNARN